MHGEYLWSTPELGSKLLIIYVITNNLIILYEMYAKLTGRNLV